MLAEEISHCEVVFCVCEIGSRNKSGFDPVTLENPQITGFQVKVRNLSM